MEEAKADKSRLYNDVGFLTSILPYRNYKNPDSLRRAARYIESEFRKTGLSTSVQSWVANENIYENIIASYHPEKEKRIIVGAHYDVYYDQPGADDNASGVAGLLELARLLAQSNSIVDYGIDFVSFSLEEPPFFKKRTMGSFVHAQSVYGQGQDIMGMISLEMIGYYSGKTDSLFSVSETKKGPNFSGSNFLVVSGIEKYADFNRKLSRKLKSAGEIGVRQITLADNNPNNGPSDHRNYWKFDYPAVMIIGGKKKGNPNYHKITDTIDTLNFDIMAATVNACAHAIFNWPV